MLICTLGGEELKGALASLEAQTKIPDEVVIVYKGQRSKLDRLLEDTRINIRLHEQCDGYFPGALNIGRKSVQSDITLFLDDDARAPTQWVETYLKMYARRPDIICFSSRDILTAPEGGGKFRPPDSGVPVWLYRRFVRPWLHPPLPQLSKYSAGVYVSINLRVTSGLLVPWRPCFSLPYRGTNMAVDTDSFRDVYFPEHPGWRRGIGNEQYMGLHFVLNGHDLYYTPDNPVIHLQRTSLSRNVPKQELESEKRIFKELVRKMLESRGLKYHTA